MDDLQQLIPEPVELTIAGETLGIGPIKMRQLSKVARHVGRIAQFFSSEEINFEGLLSVGADDLMAALSAATDKPVEWIGELNLDEIVRLTRTVVEVNADFFARTVMPEVEKAKTALSALAPPGATPSNA